MAKLAWWVLTNKDFLSVEILKAKYKVRGNWLNLNCSNSLSWTWKSLEKAKKILMDGAVKLVGDGLSIRIWDDPWVLEAPEFKPVSRIQGVESLESIVG